MRSVCEYGFLRSDFSLRDGLMSFIPVVSMLGMYRLAMSDTAYVLIGLGRPGVAWMAE